MGKLECFGALSDGMSKALHGNKMFPLLPSPSMYVMDLFIGTFCSHGRMKLARAILVILIWAASPAAAQREPDHFAEIIKQPGQIETLVKQIGMQTFGAMNCKISGFPNSDSTRIVDAMRKINAKAVRDTLLATERITRGLTDELGMVPGSEICKMVAKQIEASKASYATIAAAIRP